MITDLVERIRFMWRLLTSTTTLFSRPYEPFNPDSRFGGKFNNFFTRTRHKLNICYTAILHA